MQARVNSTWLPQLPRLGSPPLAPAPAAVTSPAVELSFTEDVDWLMILAVLPPLDKFGSLEPIEDVWEGEEREKEMKK